MQLVVLIISLNILRYASSFPTPGQNDQANCLTLEPESQNEIGTITDQIFEFLCKLSPQYQNIDISDLEITVQQHNDEENTVPAVVINDFTEDHSTDDDCDEANSDEAQSDEIQIETTSASEPGDEIDNNYCENDETSQSNNSGNVYDTSLEQIEERQINANDNSQCDEQDEIIDDLQANEAIQGTYTEDQDADSEDAVTVAILIDDVKADTTDCDSNTNNEYYSEKIQNKQGADGGNKLNGAQDNGITVAYLIDNVKPDEITCNCDINDEHDAADTRIVIADQNASALDINQEGITVALISEDVNPKITDCDSNINNEPESDNVNNNTQEQNKVFQSNTGDNQQNHAQDGVTIAFLIDDVQPDQINYDEHNAHKHTNNEDNAITIAFLSDEVTPDAIDFISATNGANKNVQGTLGSHQANIKDSGITIAFLIDA